MSRVGWLDCSSGVSGDMLLGALTDLGALDPTTLPARMNLDAQVTVTRVTRGGLAGTAVQVEAGRDQPHRTLADITALIRDSDLPQPVRERATRVFVRLADAEAAVHAGRPEDVRFHEVGGVDSIVDIVGGCMGLHSLHLDSATASPIRLGGGTVTAAHGTLPVPVPAVLELLRSTSLVGSGGPVDVELATPTGVALVAEWAEATGPLPEMRVAQVGVGAGDREVAEHPNLFRLVVGGPAATTSAEQWCVVEANVDDLDPRLWPGVIEKLLAAGAADAWLTPILMKKGRPAHTATALSPPDAEAAVRAVLVRETSTIGVRVGRVEKSALRRTSVTVDIGGQPVRVKLAWFDGQVVNAVPEFDDVAAAARQLEQPVKLVLAEAAAAAVRFRDG